MQLSWYQIAARGLFVAGVAFIFFVMGKYAFAGAGMMLLLLAICREIEARGRSQTLAGQAHWQTDQPQSHQGDLRG